jgi:15-hydroxyprostaglandin dehydrogenase (NAD)
MSARVALITGAASGIGLALSHHLLAKGYKVGICDVNEPLLTSVAAKIKSSSATRDHVLARVLDITDYNAHAAFFRDVFEWGGGRIDYFAANAGITERHSLYKRADRMEVDAQGLPKQLAQKAVDVDVKAVVDGVWLYRFYAAKRKDGRRCGRITVTASTAGLYPYPGLPLYGTSKHAIVGLVRCTALIFLKEGILMNAVCLSFVRTGLLPKTMLELWPKEHLTSKETVLGVHDGFLEGERSGQTVETSGDELFWRKPVEQRMRVRGRLRRIVRSTGGN